MEKILLVEDSRVIARMLAHRIVKKLGYEVEIAPSMAEAAKLLESQEGQYFAALLDLQLPDAPNGEVVPMVKAKQIPVVIFTGQDNELVRDRYIEMGVVDYLLKKNLHEVDYLVRLLIRLKRNPAIGVLVIDDSAAARRIICDHLNILQFQVFECDNAGAATGILSKNRQIRLVIVDYILPDGNGGDLCAQLRKTYARQDLVIIGISGQSEGKNSARFLKSGANDFLQKPFTSEEFQCRLIQNIEMWETTQEIQENANRDYLTSLYNRRFFYRSVQKWYANCARRHFSLTLAMIDVDFFKKVNDRYGHEAGDQVLRGIAQILEAFFRESDIIARFGGEEFCIACVNLAPNQAFTLFDKLRKKVQDTPIPSEQGNLHVSVSIGVCTFLGPDLTSMIQEADQQLYQAKGNGRNRVCMAQNNPFPEHLQAAAEASDEGDAPLPSDHFMGEGI
ncbi:GGDEF domain-containing response regulator [Acanthopleuribacter pedis]|uniref:diguanylate cyclase n=1 Tax=Acanthopleuribacter pedis TaxID=442870 RepID=A0A8J7QH58_9BACT|nr:response regulator [Acanthopleuribacter pedis]MBO1320291.1 diguanylate cyclase [Acanthopleuribacter pedis]